MSAENVELVKQGYAALRANDIEAFIGLVDPDVEWHSLILEIEGVSHGHEGVRRWWKSIRDVFPDWNPSVIEVRAVGDDHVLIHARGMGSGAASGVGVDDDFWQMAELRDGRVVRYHAARSEREALEAAGLSE